MGYLGFFLWDVIHTGLTPYGELDPAPLRPISCRSQCLVVTHGPARVGLPAKPSSH